MPWGCQRHLRGARQEHFYAAACIKTGKTNGQEEEPKLALAIMWPMDDASSSIKKYVAQCQVAAHFPRKYLCLWTHSTCKATRLSFTERVEMLLLCSRLRRKRSIHGTDGKQNKKSQRLGLGTRYQRNWCCLNACLPASITSNLDL